MSSAKLFKNGQSQAVRLPKEFAMPGREVYVRRIGNMVVLVPMTHPWTGFEAALEMFSDDFMEERAQAPAEERESL